MSVTLEVDLYLERLERIRSKTSEIEYLRNEVKNLDRQAREFEQWLVKHDTSDLAWATIKSAYDNVLFRKGSKEMRIESLRRGSELPRTLTVPAGMKD